MSDTISSIKLASDYNLVYVNLLTASLASPLPLRNQLKELNYYEDIYSSTIYGELVLNDATNIISNLRLNGTEFIEFKFQKTTNDNVSIERTFRVYKIGDRLTDASKNQESFIIYFCSEELMISERYRISKAYRNTPISMIVEDIFTNYLKLTPMAVGMTRPTQAQTKLYYIDPTLVLDHDIRSADGEILFARGLKVNPLDHVSLREELIFFDGRDRRQVSFAKQTLRNLKGAAKPIMVAGEPLNLMRDWKRRVFYDQGGALIRRLGIRQVPAVVTQDGKRLRVDEVRL